MASVWTKFLLPKIGGPINLIVVQQSFTLIALLIYMYVEVKNGYDISIVFNPEYMYYLLLSSLFGFLGFVTLIIGFQKGHASVGGVLLSSRVFVSIPLAYLIIGEHYPIFIYILIFFALIGSVMNSWQVGMDFKSLITFRAEGMYWFIATSIFWAFGNLMIRSLDSVFEPMHFVSIRQFIMIPMAFTAYLYTTRKLDWKKINYNPRIFTEVLFYAILLISAQFLFITALNQSLTLVEGIGVLEGSFTLLISLFVAKKYGNETLKEPLDKKSLIVKLSGTSIAMVSTIFIVISQ